jgi:glycosyltransferase involved in cell wall biosynthesis
MPTALMQAMACELLCVATPVGNISEMLEDRVNGFTFTPGDHEGLALILSRLLKVENIEEICRKARDKVIANHSYESAENKWSIILENV